MRMSCNGCRILRKGCSHDCIIRPCLQWIPSPDSQANATIFLAKFYGRAGLFNLITAAAEHLRPAIFKSLLYEACGRMVNPVYGSVGLLCSGDWDKCQAAVDAVLTGSMIVEPDAPLSNTNLSLKCCDIRHVCNDTNLAVPGELHKGKTRNRFKKPDNRTKSKPGPGRELGSGSNVEVIEIDRMADDLMTNRRKPGWVLRNGMWVEEEHVELELTLNSAQ
ncbi:LOB domain-containing protein 42-like [Cucurbita maxima]|uniref:LOB domain-containing protein 42-like n=1 Tax=Cucurbita maxima TaxID=3661 RepID=A0A6J1HWX5_CUCMA|nr:LOB domain-containing protein 42-like [Cucurbita maxima]